MTDLEQAYEARLKELEAENRELREQIKFLEWDREQFTRNYGELFDDYRKLSYENTELKAQIGKHDCGEDTCVCQS